MVETLNAVCDDKSLKLLDAIAIIGGNSGDLSLQLELSHKEFYSRLSRFVTSGMVKRKNGVYFLTAFGKLVYEAMKTMRKAIENNWKLKALDSVNLSKDISIDERENLIDTLIDDMEIKKILLVATNCSRKVG